MKKFISIVLSVAMLLSFLPAMNFTAFAADVASNFAGGSGTEADPYLIETLGQFEAFARDTNLLDGLYIKLKNDIDLGTKYSESSGLSWTPITGFRGYLDGDGHYIKNLYINSTENQVGLFGLLNGGTVKNLNVTGSVTGNLYVGGIAGYTLHNPYIRSTVISNCNNYCDVSGVQFVGGILGGTVGSMSLSANCETISMNKCGNYGNITGTGNYVGGIMGGAELNPVPENISTFMGMNACYNVGTVTGKSYVGGIVGMRSDNKWPYSIGMSYCYNIGKVTGGSYTTALDGYTSKEIKEYISGTDNNYYLAYSGSSTEAGTRFYEEWLTSGELAYTLRSYYGQNLRGENADTHPVAKTSENEVFKVQFKTQANSYSSDYAVVYANRAGVQYMPENPTGNYIFSHWATSNSASGEKFDYNSPVTSDMIVYAVGNEMTVESGANDAFTYFIGDTIDITVGDLVKNASGHEGDYTFTLKDASYLPSWISFDGEKITGTAQHNGVWNIEINVQNNGGLSLLSVDSEHKVLTVTVHVCTAEKNDPLVISSVGQLEAFRDNVNAGQSFEGMYIELGADIDLTADYYTPEKNWEPIGNESRPFKGHFDGKGYTIKGVYYDTISDTNTLYSNKGLFGCIENGSIKNLTVTDSKVAIFNGFYVGGIVGYFKNNTGETLSIDNCRYEGKVIGQANSDGYKMGRMVGGIVGYLENTSGSVEITNCIAKAYVYGGQGRVGGIVGQITNNDDDGTILIKNCAHVGGSSESVRSIRNEAGGIVGGSGTSTHIENCYNTTPVETSYNYAGGIVGWGGSGRIKNCYNLGNVAATAEYHTNDVSVGGIAGISQSTDDAVIENCYTTGTVTSAQRSYTRTYPIAGRRYASGDITPIVNTYFKNSAYYSNTGAIQKSADAFTSGELTYILQNLNSDSVWGQDLTSETKDDHPVWRNETNKVYKITFMIGDEEYSVKYTNKSGKHPMPEEPTVEDGYTFIWAIDSVNGKRFTESTEVTEDLTVYGVKVEKSVATDASDTFEYNYNASVSIDLSNLVTTASGNSTTYTFALVDGTLPKGLSLGGKYNHLISGKAQEEGEFTLVFSFADDNRVSLLSVDSEKNELTIKIKITATKFEISTIEDLEAFGEAVNSGDSSSFIAELKNDIDLSKKYKSNGESWTLIGNFSYPFKGIFDGNGHKITLEMSGENYVALFSYADGATIKNLVLDGNIYAGGYHAASIVGTTRNNTVTIENCLSSVNIHSTRRGEANHGGLVGRIYSSTVEIDKCGFAGSIEGDATTNCGGIVGYAYYTALIKNSFVTAEFKIAAGSSDTFGKGAVSTTNCYYAYKWENVTNRATQKDITAFESGEVTYLYQNSQAGSAWGQTLGKDSTPVFATDDNKVYKVTFMLAGKECCVKYANTTGVYEMPTAEDTKNYNVKYWVIADNVNGTRFTEKSPVKNDMTVYAVYDEITVDTQMADTVYYQSGQDVNIDVSKYVKNASGSDPDFTISIKDTTKFPSWLSFDNDIVTGTSDKKGTYTLVFTVENNGVSLLGLDSTGRELTITIIVTDYTGQGTEEDPFIIPDLETLEKFRNNVNAGENYDGLHFKLTADIDMSETYNAQSTSWTPVGTKENPFKGIFDGADHEIYGMYIKATSSYQGLFGVINGGEVKNLTVNGGITLCAATEDGKDGVQRVGGLVGWAYNNAKIENVKTNVTISDTGNNSNVENRYIGGIVGYLGSSQGNDGSVTTATVTKCEAHGDITLQKTQQIGGVVGIAFNACEISNNYNYANVTASDRDTHHVGGILGSAQNGPVVKYCMNLGNITFAGADCVAGIVAYTSDRTTITSCANIGTVTCTVDGNAYAGGILGYVRNNTFGHVKNCYNYGQIVTNEGCTAYAGAIMGWNRNSENAVKNQFADNYYLNTSASSEYGTDGTAIEGVTACDENMFTSGELAHILQSGNTDDVWGQMLTGDDKDTYPVFATKDNKVCKVTFIVSDERYAVRYVNINSTVTMPENPTLDNYDFSYWMTSNVEGGTKFTEDSLVKGDTTLYAWKNEKIEGIEATDTFSYTYADSVEIDLTGFVKNVFENSKNYIFALKSGTLPTGVRLDNGTLRGVAGSTGTYELVFSVEDDDISLMSFDQTTHEISITITITDGDYVIDTLEDLEKIRDDVNNGATFDGKVIELAADIDMGEKYDTTENLWTAIGSESNPFKGTFDGKGHTLTLKLAGDDHVALFPYADGATITDLVIDGDIKASGKFAAGFVGGVIKNTVTIENCLSNVTIESTVSGDGTHGGLIGVVSSGNVAINNCGFTGSIVGSKTTNCGGIIGWVTNNCHSTIKNSYVAAEFKLAKGSSDTFARNHKSTVTFENCYYAHKWENVTDAAVQKDVTVFASGEVTYLLNNRNSEGVWRQTLGENGDDYPNFKGSKVYKTAPCEDYTNDIAAKKDHTDNSNGFCAVCGKIIDAHTDENGVYKIESAGNLIWFAQFVNSDVANRSANAILMKDIDMSAYDDFESIGRTTGLYYSGEGADKGYAGTFDGNGKVIKNLSIKGSSTNELTYGVFGTLSGTVKNLGVENFTFTLGKEDCRAGGIAGQIITGGSVKDCYVVSAAIKATNKVAGGIAGCNYAGTIENCYTYNVSIDASRKGGIVGDNRGDQGTSDRLGTIKNCYTDAQTIEDSQRSGNVENSLAGVSETRFTAGEVAYLLQGSQSENVWGQTIGTDETPTFATDDNHVYKVTFDSKDVYTNEYITLGKQNTDGTYTTEDNVVGYHISETADSEESSFVGAGKHKIGEGYNITSVGFNVTMLSGAQVRHGAGVDENGKVKSDNGLRFIATVDRSNFDGEAYGMKIQAEASDNIAEVTADKWQDDTTFTVAITNLATSNYNRNYTATPFVKVKYDDGSEKTIYGTGSITRSIYCVAAGILKDGANEEGFTFENDATLYDVLNAYVNMVGIRLNLVSDEMSANTTGNGKYTGDVFFDVSCVKNENVYTVTVTPITNGFSNPVTITNYWKEFIRINNNNSTVREMISNENISADGVLTFDFTVQSNETDK